MFRRLHTIFDIVSLRKPESKTGNEEPAGSRRYEIKSMAGFGIEPR